MKLNKKGFTLVELLAVIVILVVISSIAIPTISSSLDRSKDKQLKSKKKLLVSAAELYVTDYRGTHSASGCISFGTLKNNGYIDEESMKDSNDQNIEGCVHYDANGTCSYTTSCSGCY